MSCSPEKRIPGSPCFSVLQATKSWAGPGNKTDELVWYAAKFAINSEQNSS